MAALAEAFVRVRADTSGVKEEVRRDFQQAGSTAGDDFSKGFSRDAKGRLRNERGAFVAEGRGVGEAIGEGAGEGFTDEFGRRLKRDVNGRLRDERGKFVAEGEKLGEGLGDGAVKGFAKKIGPGGGGGGGGGFGGILRGAFDAITPNIPNLVSGFGKIGDSVGDLSGRLGHLGVTGTSALTSLSTSLAKVGAGAVGLAALGAAAASAAAGATVLVGALLPAAGAIAALPALFASTQLAIVGFKIAFQDFAVFWESFWGTASIETVAGQLNDLSGAARAVGNEMLAMRPTLDSIQEAIRNGLFAPLIGQIQPLVLALEGPLSEGLAGVTRDIGFLIATVLEFSRTSDSISALNTMFGNLRGTLQGLQPALKPLLAGFRDLAVVGGAWFASLAPGIAASATSFGEFLSKASASGQALGWMTNALTVFKQLGDVVMQVGGILEAVFRAAGKAGGDALGGVATVLRSINTALSSTDGQDALVQVFQSLQKVGRALGPVIDALLKGLGTIAPAVADIAVALGPILTSAIKSLAPALAALGPGLLVIVTGIGSAVAQLGPSLVPIGQAISGAFAATGPIFAALGGAIAVLAPQIASVVAGFAPLVSVLIGSLAPALAALGPGLFTVGLALATAFANPLVSEALLALGTGIGNLLIAVAPILPVLIELAAILVERLGSGLVALAAFLTPVIAALADALAPILPVIAKLFQDVSAVLLPLAAQLGGELAGALRAVSAVLAPVAAQFGTALTGALRDLMPYLPPIMDALREVGSKILAVILQVLPQLMPHFRDLAVAFGAVFVELVKIMPDLIKFGGEILVAIIKQLPVLVPMIKDLALQFLAVFKQLVPLIPPLLKLLLEIVLPLIPELPRLLPPLIELARVFTDLLLKATPLISKLLESKTVADVIKIGSRNMVLAFELVRDAINFAVGAIQTFIGVFFGLPGQVDAGLGKMGNAIKGWVNSIIGWFESVINILAGAIPGVGSVSFPRLADGAIVDRATMAMVGEAGKEVVIPLTRPARARELAEKSGLLDILAGMKVPELSAGRRLSLAGAPAAGGAASGSPPWSDRPLIGTYVAAAGQTAQRLMSDLRIEAIGASY